MGVVVLCLRSPAAALAARFFAAGEPSARVCALALVIAAGAVIWGAVKSVFPEARLRDVFTKRNITIAVSAAVVISALDWILAACLEGYDSIKFYIITALLFVFSACFTLAFALSAARKNAAEEPPAPIPEEPVDPVITITDSAGTFTLHPEK